MMWYWILELMVEGNRSAGKVTSCNYWTMEIYHKTCPARNLNLTKNPSFQKLYIR